jgi:hypothetical protein
MRSRRAVRSIAPTGDHCAGRAAAGLGFIPMPKSIGDFALVKARKQRPAVQAFPLSRGAGVECGLCWNSGSGPHKQGGMPRPLNVAISAAWAVCDAAALRKWHRCHRLRTGTVRAAGAGIQVGCNAMKVHAWARPRTEDAPVFLSALMEQPRLAHR